MDGQTVGRKVVPPASQDGILQKLCVIQQSEARRNLVYYRYCTYLTVCKKSRGWALFSD